jgi:hypothetical protein
MPMKASLYFLMHVANRALRTKDTIASVSREKFWTRNHFGSPIKEQLDSTSPSKSIGKISASSIKVKSR